MSRRARRCLWIAALLLAPLWAVAQLAPAAQTPIVMGSIQAEGTYAGGWLNRIYAEAFRRLGIPVVVAFYPTQRLSVAADQGAVDGDVARVHGYAAAHPNLIRVEESVFDIQFGLFSPNPALSLKRLEDLPSSQLRGTYVRGVAVCENTLKPWLPAERLSDVGAEEQALNMLLAGRADFHCGSDLGVQNQMHLPEFKGAPAFGALLVLGGVTPLYPYLHRRHAALAPQLAAALRQMKAEGLIERYRAEALRAATRR